MNTEIPLCLLAHREAGAMTKLDWRKAALRTPDPARVQRTAGFIIPDKAMVKKGAKRKKADRRKPPPQSVWETALIALVKSKKERERQEADAAKAAQAAKKARRKAQKAKPAKLTKPVREARRQAERDARNLRPAMLGKVVVVRRVGGEIKSVRKLGRP